MLIFAGYLLDIKEFFIKISETLKTWRKSINYYKMLSSQYIHSRKNTGSKLDKKYCVYLPNMHRLALFSFKKNSLMSNK
jgi:hypothetical protein